MSTGSSRLRESLRPYLEAAPLAALFLGISSGFAFAMIGATLTTRLAQHGITKGAVTAFALTFLAYNFKFLWTPLVDTVRLPLIGRFGQRRSWLWFAGALVMAAVAVLGLADPRESLLAVALAAIAVGFAGATFDIVIDAYRIELLEPRQLGVGSGMSQYGWRIGAAAAGALALVLAQRYGWGAAYAACAAFALGIDARPLCDQHRQECRPRLSIRMGQGGSAAGASRAGNAKGCGAEGARGAASRRLSGTWKGTERHCPAHQL